MLCLVCQTKNLPWGAAVLFVWRQVPAGDVPWRMGQPNMTTRDDVLPGDVSALDAGSFALLCRLVDERRCREAIGLGTLAEAADAFRPSPPCPSCGSAAVRDGRTASGAQRWRCPECGRRYGSLTGTVFEHTRLGLPQWVAAITLMRLDAPSTASPRSSASRTRPRGSGATGCSPRSTATRTA